MSNTIAAADQQIEAKNIHLTSSESHFLEEEEDFLVRHISKWIHIRLVNDIILITPSLNHRDLLDV
jgi:hypothetical protein